RSDDPDSARKFRQWPLTSNFKKSFGFQFAFQHLEFGLQDSKTTRLQDLDAELVLPARFEDGEVTKDLDLHAITQRGWKRRKRIAKNHAGDRGPLILKSEVLVPRGMLFVIRNFSLYPDGTEAGLEQSADRASQLAHGEKLRARAKKIAGRHFET